MKIQSDKNNGIKSELPNNDELLDDGSYDEDDLETGQCLYCKGEGIAPSQNESDEEDKDFKECLHCGGSGIDPEYSDDNYTEFDDEN